MGLGGAFAVSAPAATYNVSPVRIALSPSASSELITLTNLTDQPISFQVSGFRWSMDEKGESRLDPTEDLLFFPQLLKVEPRGERKIRVGTAVPFGDREGAYRLIVEELRPEDNRSGMNIRLLMRMSIPVFLAPAKPVREARIQGATLQGGRLSFLLENRGNLHADPHRIRVGGRDAGGVEVFAREIEAWYVLAGGVRSFEVPLPADLCPRLNDLEIQAEVDGAALSHRLQLAEGACAP